MPTTKTLPVVLNWKDKKLELPGIPNMTPDQMLEHYSMTYPELSTSSVDAEGKVKDGKMVYEIDETLGDKG